jgi:hypothetical protein
MGARAAVLARRSLAVAVSLCLALGVTLLSATAASASTGGTATAEVVDLGAGPISVLGVPILPAVDLIDIVDVPTPGSDATGNGSETDQIVGVDLLGILSASLLSAESVRTPSGLAATAEIEDLSIGLELLGGLGTIDDLVTATTLSSAVTCPVDGAGPTTATASTVGLEIAGLEAEVGDVDVLVPITLAIPDVTGAYLLVDVTEVQSTTASTATAAALVVDVDLVVEVLGVPLAAADLLSTTLAGSECSRPTAMAPSITTIDPGSGPLGTTVTLDGVGFVPGFTTVNFGDLAVTPTTVTPDGTSLTFDVPGTAPLGSTDVSVTTPGGTSNEVAFVVTTPPVALTIAPPVGPRGTTVTITGEAFVPGATSVQFGAVLVSAAEVTVDPTGTSLTFDVPVAAPFGPTAVSVLTDGGESDELAFTVIDTPTLTDLDPDQGPEGTTVTVTGSGYFEDWTDVRFGGVVIPAEEVTVVDATTLTFVVPPGSPLGPTPVSIITTAGESDDLTFTVTAVPVALAIDPPAGPRGSVVTITGADFVPGETSVQFGGLTVAAADVTVDPTGTSLTFDVPVVAPFGPTAVSVVTPGGESDELDFTVLDTPTVSDLDPDSGVEGTTVTVTGTGFFPGLTEVRFGDTTIPAGSVTVVDDETLTFQVPDDAALGATPVSVITPAGESDELTFTVLPAPPTVAGISPVRGPVGTTVIIDGDNFVPGDTEVVFGGIVIPADQVTVATDGDSLTFVVPPGAPLGPTPVTVVTSGGQSGELSFEVIPPAPVVDGVDPDQGPPGTTVTVCGSSFIPGATTVVLGSTVIPPGAVVVASDGTCLTFVVPADAPVGTLPLTVVTDSGTSNAVPFTVTSSGGGGAATVTPSGTLPYTGGDAGPLLGLGVVLVALGAAGIMATHLARSARPLVPAAVATGGRRSAARAGIVAGAAHRAADGRSSGSATTGLGAPSHGWPAQQPSRRPGQGGPESLR